MYYSRYRSPIGSLLLAGDGVHLHRIVFPNSRKPVDILPGWERREQSFRPVFEQLDDYFEGSLKKFSVPLSPAGTVFQCKVWNALLDIGYGDKCTYRDIADAIDHPSATRAVGAANGANPIPIIIPCHRVIGSNGTLTGFGGGLATKQWLLSHEAGELSLFPFEEISTAE